MNSVSSEKLPTWLQGHMSEEDLQKIAEAVKLAEGKTSGEIVPVLVRRSSTIGHVPVILFLTLLGLFLLSGASSWFDENVADALWLNLGFLVVAGGASTVIAKLDTVQRLLTSKQDQEQQVNARAQLEFYESSIAKTKDGTGILLFLSLMEKRAVVLADRGIAELKPSDTWESVIELMTGGIRGERLAAGFSQGIEKCGELLADGFPIQSDDINELPNRLVIKEN